MRALRCARVIAFRRRAKFGGAFPEAPPRFLDMTPDRGRHALADLGLRFIDAGKTIAFAEARANVLRLNIEKTGQR